MRALVSSLAFQMMISSFFRPRSSATMGWV